jgi:small subunit ribosomal protein S12e
MTDIEVTDVVSEAPTSTTTTPATTAPAVVVEPMTVAKAIQQILRKALIHDELARGLHECVKALDRGNATLCVLAADCEDEKYVRLVEALCAARGLNLVKVPESKQLGEWSGLCKHDKEGKARKIVSTSCVVVKKIREGDDAVEFLSKHFKSNSGPVQI